MNHGLSDSTVKRIHAILANFPQVEKAVLYGSRAKGCYRMGSDIDLTLFGGGLGHSHLAQIEDALDDLLLPYQMDLSLFASLTHPDLIEHIQRVGVVLYERASAPCEVLRV